MSAQAPPPLIVRLYIGELQGFVNRLVRGVVAYHHQGFGGLQATSWWRSVADNARVGGNAKSQHMLGLALDLVGENHLALARQLRAQGLVAIEFERHVHVQRFPAGALDRLGAVVAGGRLTVNGRFVG